MKKSRQTKFLFGTPENFTMRLDGGMVIGLKNGVPLVGDRIDPKNKEAFCDSLRLTAQLYSSFAERVEHFLSIYDDRKTDADREKQG